MIVGIVLGIVGTILVGGALIALSVWAWNRKR